MQWQEAKGALKNPNHLHSQQVCHAVLCLVISDSLWPPWTVAHQAPLFMEFSKQEHWSGLCKFHTNRNLGFTHWFTPGV